MRHSSSIAKITIVLALMVSPLCARAEEPQNQQPTLTQSADAFDVVLLRSGALFRGRLTEIVPDDHVSMVVEGASTAQRFGWSTIARIVTSTTSSPAPTPTTPWLESHESGVVRPSTRADEWSAPPPPPPPQWHPNKPLLIGGVVLFSVPYGVTVLAAVPSSLNFLVRFLDGKSFRNGGIMLWLPVIGPALFASSHSRDEQLNNSGGELSSGTKAALYTSAGVQFAGLTLAVIGLALGKTDKPQYKPSKGPSPSFYLAPLDVPNAHGFSVGIHRW